MVSQQNIIDYFNNIATQHRRLNSGASNKKAFFFIPEAYNLTEIDNAIRNLDIAPFIMLDAMRGTVTDNGGESHTNDITIQFSILDEAEVGNAESIRGARDSAFKIGTDVLTRMKADSRARNFLAASPNARMRINNVHYNPIGPMQIKYYGYVFSLTITCPFSFEVTSATWLDIT